MGYDSSYVIIKNGVKEYLALSKLLVCTIPQKRSKEQQLKHFNWWKNCDLKSSKFDDGDEQTIITHKTLNGEILDYLAEPDLEDTLSLGTNILEILKNKQPITYLPQEIDFEDYLYIDESNRCIHVFWGYPWLIHPHLLYHFEYYWQGWQVFWNGKRYKGHLALSGRQRDDLLLSQELAINRLIERFASRFKHDLEYARNNFENYNQNHVLSYQRKLAFLETIKQEYDS